MSLSSDKELKILIHRTPCYVIIYTVQELCTFKLVRFLAHPVDCTKMHLAAVRRMNLLGSIQRAIRPQMNVGAHFYGKAKRGRKGRVEYGRKGEEFCPSQILKASASHMHVYETLI